MIITIANEKGGSGKSTLCLNLCVQLLLDKKDIVALDTDSQKSLEVFNNIRSETSLPNFTLFNRTGNITDTLKQMMDKYEYILIDTGRTFQRKPKGYVIERLGANTHHAKPTRHSGAIRHARKD